jgi:hypothetical protein
MLAAFLECVGNANDNHYHLENQTECQGARAGFFINQEGHEEKIMKNIISLSLSMYRESFK